MMNAQSNLLFDTALRYTQAGINILPAVRAAKFPKGISWKQHQDNPATVEQLREWFDSNRFNALCLLTGNEIEAIDFDCRITWETFWATMVNAQNGLQLAKRLTIQGTPSGGVHVVYRVAGTTVPSNQVLARGVASVPASGLWSIGADGLPVQARQKGPHVLEGKQDKQGQWSINPTLIETRGTGGLILIAPSEGYRLLQGSFESLPVLMPDERDWLIDQARSFNQDLNDKCIEQNCNPSVINQSNWQPDTSKIGDRYSARTTPDELLALLVKHHWTFAGSDKQHYQVTRPGKAKEEGVSGTIRLDSPIFHCFSTNAPPFEGERSYSPFAVFTLLEHEGNFQKATKFLAEAERQWSEPTLESQKACVYSAIAKAKAGDPGAPLELSTTQALADIKRVDRPEYVRLRDKIKREAPSVPLTELDQAVKEISGHSVSANDKSNADILIAQVKREASLFHGDEGEAYASFTLDGHEETWSLTSRGFSEWVSMRLYQDHNKALRVQSFQDTINALRAFAKYEGEEHKVWLRVAMLNDCYYLDLCDKDWHVIEITPDYWRLLEISPVKFRRTQNMRPLPIPVKNGDFNLLWKCINVPENDRLLILAYILESLRPDTHFPVLEFTGEQGCGKSFTQNKLRDLIDPSSVNLRSAPKSSEDILVSGFNNWLISYNNLSILPASQQDVLCTLSTGGGSSARKLYTDHEECAFDTHRPVIVNGIARLITAQDLLDRTIHITLPQIPYKTKESDLKTVFNEAYPSILGGILDLFSKTLKLLQTVNISEPPRLADFAYLGEAMARVMGFNCGSFLSLYNENCKESKLAALDSSPSVCAVMDFVRNEGIWEGTFKDLFSRISLYRDGNPGWPKSAKGLSGALRRAAPALRLMGFVVEREQIRRNDGFHIKITYIGNYNKSEVSVATSPNCVC